MTPTPSQNHRSNKFNTMYGNFAEPAYGRDQVVRISIFITYLFYQKVDKTKKTKKISSPTENVII